MTRVLITGWERGLKKISLSELLHQKAGLTLSQAKRSVDDLLEGQQVDVSFPSAAAATEFAAAARQLNATCVVTDVERSSG